MVTDAFMQKIGGQDVLMSLLDARLEDGFYQPVAAARGSLNSRGRKRRGMARRGLVKMCAILLIVFTGVTFYQRLTMECSVARKNSAHFERVYNEAQDEVAEWRRKYDAESARAEECNSKLTRDLKKRIEELEDALTQLATEQKNNQKHVDEIMKLNAVLPKSRDRHANGVDKRKGDSQL